ncbi:MAG: hypothetical protein KJ622_11270 [Alphaproteobacteria bacterium]|nr:hypothetical protein [Alphaproteobacteria bacterium]
MVQLGEDTRAPLDVICYGVGKRQLRQLIGSAGKYVEAHLAIELRARRIKVSKNAKLTTNKLWALMARELKPGNVVILGLGGREDHWTLAYAMTDRQMRLLDSSGRRVLRRSACTVRKDRSRVVLSAHDITIIERKAKD